MPEKFKWGIISTGYVAHEFIYNFRLVRDAEIIILSFRVYPFWGMF